MSSWDDLRSWLISNEGGKLRVVEPSDSAYALVTYVKGKSDFTLPHVPWCRSVIVHKSSRLPVCVSPVKSQVLTETSVTDATVAEEFVDGTMINVFHSGNDECAGVSTRGRLGADKGYYVDGPSFYSMFMEAMLNQGTLTLNDILPNSDNPHRFTSLVLQHPMNRLVKKVNTASFVIVHQGWVNADGLVFIEEDSSHFNYLSSSTTPYVPEKYNLESVRAAKTVKDWVSSQAQERGLGWQGLVLKKDGFRWRERSDVYDTLRTLRGNESSMEQRYARLRKSRSVDQYLTFYPEDKESMYNLEGLLRKNTRQLLYFYTDVFRSRKTAFYELPWPYKHHVSVLHNYYKNTLRGLNKKLDVNEVVKYVNSLNLEDTVNMLKQHNLELKKSDRTPSTMEVDLPEANAPVEA
jgi:hypothetical protein